MYWIKALCQRLVALFKQDDIERDMDREMRSHRDQIEEEYRELGKSEEDARLAAQHRFGNLEQVKEYSRDVRGSGIVGDLLRDFQYAIRSLRRSLVFTTNAVLTIALGIGATTVAFSIVDTFVTNSVPFQGASRLVEIYRWSETGGGPIQPGFMLPVWRQQTSIFEQVEAHWEGSFVSIGGEVPEELWASQVTVGLFDFLGVAPQLGRTFDPDDSNAKVAIISHALWLHRFGGSQSVVGQPLRLDDDVVTVVGVMPSSFRFPIGNIVDLWLPLDPFQPNPLSPRQTLSPVARIREGLPFAQADEQVAALSREFDDTLSANTTARLQPLERLSPNSLIADAWFVQNPRVALLLILGAAGLVFLAACTNAANLFLSRGLSRSREFAVRASLGGNRLRLMRQILTETLVVALAAGVLGLLLALWTIDALSAVLPPELVEMSLNPLNLDLRAGVWVIGSSLLAGLVAAAVPTVRSLRRDLNEVLQERVGHVGEVRFRGILVSVQTAVALLLFVVAGLMVESVREMIRVDNGFEREGVVVLEPLFRNGRYSEPSDRWQFMTNLSDELREVPGVVRTAFTDSVPLRSYVISFGTLESDMASHTESEITIGRVSDDYFRTLGIPLYQGSSLDSGINTENEVVITREMAQSLWGDTDPVGQRFRLEGSPFTDWTTVVGVVGDVQSQALTVPGDDFLEIYQSLPPDLSARRMRYIAIKTDGQEATMAAIRNRVSQIDAELPVNLQSMDDIYRETLVSPLFNSALLGAFAIFTLLLSCTGVYSAVAYEAVRRRREMAIRVALGAVSSRVIRHIMYRSLTLATVGVVLGTLSAIALTRLMGTMLYEIQPTDATTFTVGVLVVMITVALAGYLPAHRALTLRPAEILTHE